ncbi:MAG: hypothetical protein KF900_07990 [Bacteroidetes bacterium]|nr:hypothetical protein [Bacteroidota bacterium]
MAKTKSHFLSIAVAALLITSDMKAQWYGQIYYQHNNVTLSSGKRTPIAGSFILGSFIPNKATAALHDFSIDVVDQNNATYSAWEYQITNDCNGVINSNFNCNGITVIENSAYNGTSVLEKYVLAGGTDDMIFFASLGITGNIINQVGWSYATYYKPVIRESVLTPGEFYICASDGFIS